MQTRRKQKGFTLIELLIVIALIAIIAAVAFVALDPLTRFQDARDARRISDASAIITAIKVSQVDNGGQYLYPIHGWTLANNTTYMIQTGATSTTGCADDNGSCDTAVSADDSCINLDPLVDAGYLAEIPVSPTGSSTWSTTATGYTLTKTGNSITIRACESENTDEIEVKR